MFSTAAPAAAGRPQDLDLNGTGSPDIWIAEADGSQARQLVGGSGGYSGWSWSPDSRRVAFASNREGSWDIYALGASGTGLTRLTASPSQDGWPAWMPDGATIVFASTRSDRAQLYRMGAGGGDVTRLLISNTVDSEPAVSRDGKIAFSTRSTDGNSEIAVLDTVGDQPKRLANPGGDNTNPAWSPDGTKLVFVSASDGHSDLFAINSDGTGIRRLTTVGQNQRPDWGIAPPDILALRVLQNLAQGESRRRQGTLEAVIDDGKGTQTTIRLLFDLGDKSGTPRLRETTTTRRSSSVTVDEEIIVGDRTWRRQADQPWREVPLSAKVPERVNTLLPPLDSAQQVAADLLGTGIELRWRDTGGVEMTLLVDALGDVPMQLRQEDPSTRRSVIVRYKWDLSEVIEPPIVP